MNLTPGKRYRVTFEGPADHTAAGEVGVRYGDRWFLYPPHIAAAVSVEELPDPLPTTPGALVRYQGDLFVFVPDGEDDSLPWRRARPAVGEESQWASALDLQGPTVEYIPGGTS